MGGYKFFWMSLSEMDSWIGDDSVDNWIEKVMGVKHIEW